MDIIASSARNATKPLHVHKITVVHTLHDTDREERLSFVNWYDHRVQVVEICPQ
jgi:hypothetical protein